LRPGLELNDAEALLAAWAEELDSALRDYVAQYRDAERRRIEEREEAARRLAEAQLNESRFLTSIAEAELRDGNIERAILIARAALPSDMGKRAANLEWRLCADRQGKGSGSSGRAPGRGHQRGVQPRRARIVTASQDNTARLGRFKAAQQRRIAGLSHSRTAHRVEAHRLSVQCSGRRVDRGSQPGLDKGSS
jgi:hypothetical protein